MRRDALAQLAHYPAPRFRAKNTVMRQKHIAEEVDTLAVFSECHFVRVEIEMQMLLEE